MAHNVEPGDYKIISGTQGPDGKNLYLTVALDNRPLIPLDGLVLAIEGAGAQVFTVSGLPPRQSISVEARTLFAHATQAGDFVRMEPNLQDWIISWDETTQLYSIQMIGEGLFWDLAGRPAHGVPVDVATFNGNLSQYWLFERVPV